MDWVLLGFIGNSPTKIAPPGSLLTNAIVPLWAFIIRLQMARPSPVPFVLVVKNGLKKSGSRF